MLKTFQNVPLESYLKYDRPVPRYTSYPTAVKFHEIEESQYSQTLSQLDKKPLSIYIHIPFCQKMCLYCGCSVILNRNEERQEKYVQALLREIKQVQGQIQNKAEVEQVHFGGGTPTNLTDQQMERIFTTLREGFTILDEAEISIEIDPRTVVPDGGRKLKFYHEIGFNRVSFGVQDTNDKVQEAVRRRQPYSMSLQTVQWARAIGFQAINVDLIYGLPFQTYETFQETAEKILSMEPDRIALFSYAKVPWLKPHQKAIRDKDLPSKQEKLAIYAHARSHFIENGYVAIGMDHFSKKDDSLSKAYVSKSLVRNFQGYSVQKGQNMLGFGVSAIGYVNGLYVANTKDLSHYQHCIDQSLLPVERGYSLNSDDHIRSWVIQKIMCNFSLDMEEFFSTFKIPFKDYFRKELAILSSFSELAKQQDKYIVVTELGELFVRIVASIFDKHYELQPEKFSQSI